MRQEDLNKLQALKEKLNNEMTQNNEVKHIDGRAGQTESDNVHSDNFGVAINKTNYTKDSSDEWKNREYKRGMVFWCDLSGSIGSEQSSDKNGRPCVIIQNNVGNTHAPTVIVAVLTSRLTKAKLPMHLELMDKKYNLPKNSIALFEQIRTLDKRRIGDFITYLGDDMQEKLDNAVDISMKNLKPKSYLEKLPEIMRTFIVTTLKQIKKYEITVETMKNEGMTNDEVQFIVNKKLSVLNKFIKYCKEHQIDYTAFYKLNEGVVNKEIVL